MYNCKYGIFVAKICKYGIFVAKICKYALIDRFQGSAGFLDNAASLAALLLTAVLHSHVELSIKDYLSTEIRVTSFTSEAEQDTYQLFPKSVGSLVKIEAKACQAHRRDKIQPIYWSAGRYILTCNNEL